MGDIPRLILLRHAEPAADPRRFLGVRDNPPLSARGRAQASTCGAELRCRVAIGLVVCSPLSRAVETARLAFSGLKLRIDDRLAEQDFGELTGLTWEEAKSRFGDRARAWRRGEAPAPDGESHEVLRRRVVEAAAAAAGEIGRGEIVLVTHHTPIRALVASVRGWPPTEWRRIAVPWAGRRIVRAARLDAMLRTGDEARLG
jgi:broad specificity phosphatase PhoE